jgi:hypothetical protein
MRLVVVPVILRMVAGMLMCVLRMSPALMVMIVVEQLIGTTATGCAHRDSPEGISW